MAFWEKYPWLLPAAFGILFLVVLIAFFSARRERRRSYLRQRRDAENQSRQMDALNDALNDLTNRLADTTDELSRRQDRLRDSVDARKTAWIPRISWACFGNGAWKSWRIPQKRT